MRLPIGIEITERYLKLVATSYQVLKHAKLFDCIVEPVLSLSDEQITKTIQEALHKTKLKPKSLVVSLPRNFVTVRNLHLPSQDPKEINQMVDLHIGRIVPYKKEDILFGHQSLGIDDLGYTKEILAIVHNDIIKRQSKILEQAGLFIDKITLSSYGAWQWCVSTCSNEIDRADLYLLLDIDTSFCDFIIFNQDNLLFSRSMTVDLKEELTSQEITKLIGEVKQSLVTFHNEEINKRPAKIFISGAGVVKNLDKVFETEFEIPAKLVPFPYTPESLKIKNRTIPNNVSLSAVAELILESSDKRISFILPEIQIRKTLKEKTRELTILGSLLIYLFMVSLAFLWGRQFIQQTYLKKLKQRSALVRQDIGDLLSQSKKVAVVRKFLYGRRLPLLLLYELQRVVPQEIFINLINIDESNKITLRGQGFQLSDVFRFINTLEGSKYFNDVQAKYTRTKRTKDREVTDFEITLQLAPEEI